MKERIEIKHNQIFFLTFLFVIKIKASNQNPVFFLKEVNYIEDLEERWLTSIIGFIHIGSFKSVLY